MAVAISQHVSYKSLAKTLRNFGGLPHRLSKMGVFGGRIWVDDSFATAPDSTIAALRLYSQKDPLLIVGGSSKGYGFEKLASDILKSGITRVILIGETASEIDKSIKKIAKQTSTKTPSIYSHGINGMEDIVKNAICQTIEGDTILFSPGCASFGMFKNVYDRAEQFETVVNRLK